MFAPFATYRRLVPTAGPRGLALLARPCAVALVLGLFVTVSNAGTLWPTLLIGSTFAWAWVPALQLALATPFIALARRRPVGFARAIDLFFLAHLPWSLWLLVVAGVLMASLPVGALADPPALIRVLLTFLVPVLWTALLLLAFARVVLAWPWVLAAAFVVLYQAAIWFAAYLYVGAATYRLWPFALYARLLP